MAARTLGAMGQVVQLVGAALILGAYVAAQRGMLRFDSIKFLALNSVGAGILAVVAGFGGPDYGFMILEGVWCWVSLRGLRKAIAAQKAAKREEELRKRSNRPTSRGVRRRNRPNPLRKV